MPFLQNTKNLIKKYLFIPIHLRITNFVFQRIFRVNGKCGFSVHYTSQIRNPENLTVKGDTVLLFAKMSHCNIQALHGIEINEGTVIASGVTILSANHDIKDLWVGESPPARSIVIGPNCWLGANSIILPGVRLGERTIIGAGSVVTKSFEKGNQIIAGNPAKLIREI